MSGQGLTAAASVTRIGPAGAGRASPNCFGEGSKGAVAFGGSDGRQIKNLRYSRLKICATSESALRGRGLCRTSPLIFTIYLGGVNRTNSPRRFLFQAPFSWLESTGRCFANVVAW